MCIVVNKYGVVLRNWKNQDVEDYAALVSDPEVMRYIRDGSTREHETAVVEIQRFRQEIANRGWSRWALTVPETGEFIGYIGFADTDMGIDLGGRTKKKFWNTAYPYIGFFLAMQYGFEVLGFNAVYTRTNVLNSRALSSLIIDSPLPYTSFPASVIIN